MGTNREKRREEREREKGREGEREREKSGVGKEYSCQNKSEKVGMAGEYIDHVCEAVFNDHQ